MELGSNNDPAALIWHFSRGGTLVIALGVGQTPTSSNFYTGRVNIGCTLCRLQHFDVLVAGLWTNEESMDFMLAAAGSP